jgi:hypothetical protein
MNQRRTLHQRVVDVEECGRGQVNRRLLRPGGGLGLDVDQRALGAGIGRQRLQFRFSRVRASVGAGFCSVRAAGSTHGSTVSALAALGWLAEAVVSAGGGRMRQLRRPKLVAACATEFRSQLLRASGERVRQSVFGRIQLRAE